jgi:hypothetical protein
MCASFLHEQEVGSALIKVDVNLNNGGEAQSELVKEAHTEPKSPKG